MTDKIKKLESLTDDVQPEFPTLSRGGYVEDTVDDWLSNHLREVNEIIQYQNYGVDVVDSLEEELEQAKALIVELESRPAVVEAPVSPAVDASELDALRVQLATAKSDLAKANSRVKELENAEVGAFPSGESETVQASILLQHATKLGSQYIEKAKEDGEQIRRDAEATVVELRMEIEELEAQRFATFRSLDDFFSTELENLRKNNLFAIETGSAYEEESADLEAESETKPASEASSLEESDDKLETLEFLEEDEDSAGNSK